MRLFVAVCGALFLAMAVVIAVKLSEDFLPAKHLDVGKSAYFVDAQGQARLHLVVLDVAPDGEPLPRILPPNAPGEDAVVELRKGPRAPQTPEHEGTVTLDLVVPRSDHLTVIDYRWGLEDHPEGHRFALQSSAPRGWKPGSP